MDNVIHTLAGGLIGLKLTKKKTISSRPVIAASLIANNFPDLDILYCSFLSQPFGYLLHHRGHTHTLIGALGCAILSFLLVNIFYKIIAQPLTKITNSYVALVTILGVYVHLGLDWLNTYGVHPFWPFSNRWHYGDTIFIVEPTLWIVLSIACYSLVVSKWAKIISILPSILGTILIIFSAKVPPPVIISIFLVILLLFFISRQRSPALRSGIWTMMSFVILFIFYFSGMTARKSLEEETIFEDEVLISYVGPSPANPFCWTYFKVINQGNNIIYQRGFIQPYQSFINLDCARYSLFKNLNTEQSVTIPLTEFQQFSNNCRWNAFLQFARVPAIVKCPDGKICSNDLRFNRKDHSNFSTLPLDGSCPENLPPWEPPVNFPENKS